MNSHTLPAKVFNARCLPLALAALVAGLLCMSIEVWWITGIAMVLIAALILALTLKHRRRRGVGVTCLVCLFAAVSVCIPASAYSRARVAAVEDCNVTGRVVEVSADEIGRIDALVLDDLRVNGTPVEGKMQVSLPVEEHGVPFCVFEDAFAADAVVGYPIALGQTVRLHGDVSPIAWDYYRSRNMHNIARRLYRQMRATSCEVQDEICRTSADAKVRLALYRTLRRNMSGQSAGMAYAFLTGNSCYVPDDVLAGYRLTGVAHLLAVSGLHVGVLAGVLLWVLKRLRCPAWGKTLTLAVVLGIYAWLCGGAPSVVRATVVSVGMPALYALGCHRDRPSMLALAGLVLLLVNPLWLFDVSFLLSYAAFAGIVLLYPPVRKALGKVRGKWGDALALNLAVTASTLPLSVYFFGGFGALAVPVNFVLIPIMSVVYVGLLVLALVSAVPVLGILLVSVDYALRAVNTSVAWLGQWGYCKCTMTVWQLPLFYGGVLLESPYCLLPAKLRHSLAAVAVGGFAVLTVLLSLFGAN